MFWVKVAFQVIVRARPLHAPMWTPCRGVIEDCQVG